MTNLLKTEWLKVKNYRAFWILLILYIVAIFGVNFIAWTINSQVRQSTAGSLLPSLYAWPTLWNMTTYVSTFLFLFPGLLIVNHTGNEFSFKTTRQNIIDGWQRKDFITVKLAFAVFISAVATLAVFLTGLLIGSLASEGVSGDLTVNIYYLFYFFLQTLLYCIFAIFIVVWVRKSGLSIGIYFAYSLVIENIISGLMFWSLKTDGNTRFRQLLPLESSDALIRTPKVQELLPGQNFPDTTLIGVSCFYILLFAWLSYRSFTRRDL